MKYEILEGFEERKNSFVGKVKLEKTGEIGVLKKGKRKEILKEEGKTLRSLPVRLGPKWLGEWEEGEFYFLFMEYVEGQTLEEYVKEKGGKLNLREAVEVMEGLIEEVCRLHEQNPPILYRDLKPSNIMYGTDGRVRLVDFGGARILDGSPKKWKVGSPIFGAPEQLLDGGRESKASDVYGLGAVFSYLLSGTRKGRTEEGKEGECIVLSKKWNRPWKQMIEKCMCWDPEFRYPDGRLLLFDIKRAFYEPGGNRKNFPREQKKRKLKWEKNIQISADVT